MPSTLSIPLDVIELVMDLLKDMRKVKALKRCALVSRALLPLARRHLFCEITLAKEFDCTKLLKVFELNPHIAVYARQLKIISVESWSDSNEQQLVQHHHVLLTSILTAILPYLHKFILINRQRILSFKEIPEDLSAALLQLFQMSRLVGVEIYGMYGLPLTHLARCTQLKHLIITPEKIYHSDDPHTESVFLPQSIEQEQRCELESLEVGCCGKFVELFLPIFNVSTLKQLRVGSKIPLSQLQALLCASQQSLEHLYWYAISTDTVPNPSSIDLSRLKDITVYHECYPAELAFLASLLEGGAPEQPRALESMELILEIEVDFSTVGAELVWSRLEAALTQRRYSKVRNVALQIISTWDLSPKDFEKPGHPFWEQVPSLHGSGLLKVWWNDRIIMPEM